MIKRFILTILCLIFITQISVSADMTSRDDAIITEGVIKEFRDFSKYPHCTYNEAKAAEYIFKKADILGGKAQKDKNNNVIIDIPATVGFENSPLTAFQGHMDMVCATEGKFNPKKDAPVILVSGDRLMTDGRSSLGADCAIGNSAILWLLENRVFNHGPIRLIFTVEEEVGLNGARMLDKKYLENIDYLVNLDGFKTGKIVIGSAGGRRETYMRTYTPVAPEHQSAYRIQISGLRGGHSGYDINKGRANAIKLIGSFLYSLDDLIDIDFVDLNAGTAHNVIPVSAEITILVHPSDEKILESEIKKFSQIFKNIFSVTDPQIIIKAERQVRPGKVYDEDTEDALIRFLTLIDNGLYANMQVFPEIPDTSSNIGYIRTSNNTVKIMIMLRSCNSDLRKFAIENHRQTGKLTGFECTVNQYDGWIPDPENKLAAIYKEAYKYVTGNNAIISAEHIGLETSVLADKNPNMTIISTGCDITDAHSVKECVRLSSIPPYVKMTERILIMIAGMQK